MATRSVLGLMYTIQSLRQLGEDPDVVLQRHGLDLGKLAPGSQIDRALELRINVECSEQLRDPLAGLKTGRHFAFTAFGPFTMLLLTCENVAQGIATGIQFQNLTYLYSRLSFKAGAQQIALAMDLLPLPAQAFRFRLDLELAGTLRLFTDMATANGFSALPERIDVAYPRPPEFSAYEAYFGCPVRFDAPATQIWYRSELLAQRFVTHDPVAYKLYLDLCEQQALQQESKSLEKLSEQVALHLDLFSGELPDAAGVAEHFGLSERTFRRRLGDEDSSFRQLLNDAQYRRAQQLLRGTRLSIEEIAAKLGYAEASAFTHAFQRWAGVTPQAFRSGG